METKIVVIVTISAISIFFRWFAFNRVDSVAMEFSIVSLAVKLLETITKYRTAGIVRRDIGLCAFLFLLVAVLSCFHHANYSTLLGKIENIINEAKPDEKGETEQEKAENDIRREGLENTLPLARHAIFLTYSFFLENRFKFYVRRGKKSARENFANLINSLSKLTYKIESSDLLLTTGTQIGGLAVFTLLGGLSVYLAVC